MKVARTRKARQTKLVTAEEPKRRGRKPKNPAKAKGLPVSSR